MFWLRFGGWGVSSNKGLECGLMRKRDRGEIREGKREEGGERREERKEEREERGKRKSILYCHVDVILAFNCSFNIV